VSFGDDGEQRISSASSSSPLEESTLRAFSSCVQRRHSSRANATDRRWSCISEELAKVLGPRDEDFDRRLLQSSPHFAFSQVLSHHVIRLTRDLKEPPYGPLRRGSRPPLQADERRDGERGYCSSAASSTRRQERDARSGASNGRRIGDERDAKADQDDEGRRHRSRPPPTTDRQYQYDRRKDDRRPADRRDDRRADDHRHDDRRRGDDRRDDRYADRRDDRRLEERRRPDERRHDDRRPDSRRPDDRRSSGHSRSRAERSRSRRRESHRSRGRSSDRRSFLTDRRGSVE
ncbi:unnamed protein product, partial [Polarella glacialis]